MKDQVIEEYIIRILNECCYVNPYSTSINCDMDDAVRIVKELINEQ